MKTSLLVLVALSAFPCRANPELDAKSDAAIREIFEVACGDPCRVAAYRKAYDTLHDDLKQIIHGCSLDKADFDGIAKETCEEGRGVELLRCTTEKTFDLLTKNPDHLKLFYTVHHTMLADLSRC